jgi:hypothetical protein
MLGFSPLAATARLKWQDAAETDTIWTDVPDDIEIWTEAA